MVSPHLTDGISERSKAIDDRPRKCEIIEQRGNHTPLKPTYTYVDLDLGSLNKIGEELQSTK